MYGENIKIIPTHEDIFGVRAKTETEIIEGLNEFSSLTIYHLCTKLMLFLNSSGAYQGAKYWQWKSKKLTELPDK